MKMDVPAQQETIEPEEEVKAPKTETKLVSFELFKSGKSIAEIAEIRHYAFSTIEEHLVHYVGTGELEIEGFVTPEKIALISGWFLKNPTLALGPAKAELGDGVSYSELKFVRKYLEYSKQITL